MVNHFEPEPREVLSRVEVPTVEASDDRVDALLLFAAVDRRFYQPSRRGGAAITLIHEQAPQERNVQALQMEMARQADDTPHERKSVVMGKRASERVDLGGSRIVKKK